MEVSGQAATSPRPGPSFSPQTTAAPPGPQGLTGVDVAVLVLYFVFVLAVGLWSMWRTKRETVTGYFLAGKSMVWWTVGASLFASNVGSGHFMGLAGSAAASGIAVAAYEFNGMFVVLLLAWIFLPIYIASGVTTMPEYLQRRFGSKRIRIYIAVLYLFIYIFTKISVDMYAGAVFIQQALNWNLYVAVALLLAITALYTIGGGLAAVIYTDTLQTLIMFIGALILMGFSFWNIGGYENLYERYFLAIPERRGPNSTCGIPREDAFHMFRDPVTSDLPWPGVVVGMTIPSVWYWCTDQVIVQRSLSAKNLVHAKGASLFASSMKVLPLFMMVFPGMISRVLFTEEVACVDPEVCEAVCQSRVSCTDIAYPKLVMELLPEGLRGLMMSVMIAALMSSLTSIFNSSSTIFTMDLWLYIHPHASERELMIVGRVFVLVLVAVSIVWIPVVQASQGGQLFFYIQAISSYLQPPVAVAFMLACAWRRANESGTFWGLMVGFAVGVVRMILDFVYPEPGCDEKDTRPSVTRYVHYLYFSMILSFITLVVVVAVSAATDAPRPEQLARLTWFTRHDKSLTPAEDQNGNDPCVIATVDTGGIEKITLCDNTSTARRDSEPKGDAVSVASVPRRRPLWKRALLWFCGLDGPSSVAGMELAGYAAPAPTADVETALYEDPRARRLMNACLILWMSVGVFLWAYFG